ncbi:hypothetical protein FIBSPDRAFT_1054965 [Athelia psychrophila]|uniref:Uncharacterized protein n=1 Tax=Athelia psychrophila TaxID=1759441 RepID=A0A167UIH0_9AGAM|nr:hypothetical protein FIBSPDRAFT_1054965 [Fibularhizoctonia sp. CBS 109695]
MSRTSFIHLRMLSLADTYTLTGRGQFALTPYNVYKLGMQSRITLGCANLRASGEVSLGPDCSREKYLDSSTPHAEEHDARSLVDESRRSFMPQASRTSSGRFVAKTIAISIDLYPSVDVSVQAYVNALATAQYLDKAVILQVHEFAVLIEQHRWEYRTFSFILLLF